MIGGTIFKVNFLGSALDKIIETGEIQRKR